MYFLWMQQYLKQEILTEKSSETSNCNLYYCYSIQISFQVLNELKWNNLWFKFLCADLIIFNPLYPRLFQKNTNKVGPIVK